MGSGKSTVGRRLAKAMNYRFIDLDETIEARAGQAIPRLFERYGEDDFRRREREALEAVIGEERVVIATGGGIMASAANRRRLSDAGTTVWLSPDFRTIARRLAAGSRERPLFEDPVRAEELFRRRLSGYQAADLRVEVGDEEAVDETTGRIAELIRTCAT